MRGVRRLRGIWRGASFSLKFAAVILVVGVTIAVVPLMLAEAGARTQAENSATQRVSIAANLIDGQRVSLETFIAGVGRQFAAGPDLNVPADVQAALTEDGSVIGTDDILGLIQTDGTVIAVQGQTVIASALPQVVLRAATSGTATAASAGGRAWLVSGAPVLGTTATVFVARPLSSAFINTIDDNIATTADPVGIVLTRGTQSLAVGGDAASLAPALSTAIAASNAQIVSLELAFIRGRLNVDRGRADACGHGALLGPAARVAVDPLPAGSDPRRDAGHRCRRAVRSAPAAATPRQRGGGTWQRRLRPAGRHRFHR